MGRFFVSWRTRHTKPACSVNREPSLGDCGLLAIPFHSILFCDFMGLPSCWPLGSQCYEKVAIVSGHKLGQPQAGLAVTKMVTTAAAVRLHMLLEVGYMVKVTQRFSAQRPFLFPLPF